MKSVPTVRAALFTDVVTLAEPMTSNATPGVAVSTPTLLLVASTTRTLVSNKTLPDIV